MSRLGLLRYSFRQCECEEAWKCRSFPLSIRSFHHLLVSLPKDPESQIFYSPVHPTASSISTHKHSWHILFWYKTIPMVLMNKTVFNFIFKLYIIVLVLPNIKVNPPQVYMCSPSWTLLPPPSPYHPSGSSQCTSPKHPVSCIEPGLATCFIHDILHVAMPFSQIFPPSPSPTESIRLVGWNWSLLYRVK